MDNIYRLLVLILAVFLSVSATANSLGEQQYAVCSACHGAKGEGNPASNSPALAGQHNWYIEQQLRNFSKEIRGSHASDIHGKTMQPFAKQIMDDEKRKALAEYISALPAISIKGTSQGNMMNGERYYHAKCGACHGGKAQGNKAFSAPKLSGQNLTYLKHQMRNFKSGTRGYQQEDKLGKQMAMMSRIVADDELTDILHFIAEQ